MFLHFFGKGFNPNNLQALSLWFETLETGNIHLFLNEAPCRIKVKVSVKVGRSGLLFDLWAKPASNLFGLHAQQALLSFSPALSWLVFWRVIRRHYFAYWITLGELLSLLLQTVRSTSRKQRRKEGFLIFPFAEAKGKYVFFCCNIIHLSLKIMWWWW